MKVRSFLLSLICVTPLVGCTTLDKMAHELKPHRLWRFNRYPEPGREDSRFFSVRDTEAEAASEASGLSSAELWDGLDSIDDAPVAPVPGSSESGE